MDFIYSVILGVVEGLTEFLPVSSTGHLLVASALLNTLNGSTFLATKGVRDTFDIFIQVGAVVAIVLYFGRDLLRQAQQIPSSKDVQRFWLNILIAFLPAAIIGFLFRKTIEQYLFNPFVIGLALIVGGVIFLLIEREERPASVTDMYKISPAQALGVGIAQIAALIPGTSRSGATIIGGMLLGLNRKVATAFAFYLAIPTLGIATLYSLYSAVKDGQVHSAQLPYFAVGSVVAFIFAYASIAWFLRYISTNNFRSFGIYRIMAGLLILALVIFTSILAS